MSSKRNSSGSSGGAAAAAQIAGLFADGGAHKAVEPTTSFELSAEAGQFIAGEDLVSHPLEDGKGTAATQFEQMPMPERKEMVSTTVRFIVAKALAGDGLIRATEVMSAVMRPGKFNGCGAIKGPFLVQKAARYLKADWGMLICKAYKTVPKRACGAVPMGAGSAR